jgi:hypothetical protein
MPHDFTPNEIAALGYEQHQIDRMSDEEREGLAERLELGIDVNEELLNKDEEKEDDPKIDDGDGDAQSDGDAVSEKDADPSDEGGGDDGVPGTKDAADPDPADPPAPEPEQAEADRLKAEARFALECEIFDQSFVDKPQAVDVTKEKEEQARLTTERTDLRKKLRDGDLEQDAYDTAMDALDEKLSDVRAEIKIKERAAAGATQTEDQRWEAAQKKFFAHAPNEELRTDPANLAVVSAFVKQLFLDPKTADKGMMWILREAGRQARVRLHLPDPAAPAQKAEAKPAAKVDPLTDKTKKPVRRPDTKKVPQTISTVPQADQNNDQDDSGEFSDLDKLDGEAYQRALAKLSTAQMRRYREQA